MEKSSGIYDSTPIAHGIASQQAHDDVEYNRRGSRKGSIVASIKANYGIAEQPASDSSGSIKEGFDSTHRKLKPRHIQLIGIGGTIGTALYVNIGKGVLNGGPASLFLAFTIWYVIETAKYVAYKC